MMNDHTNSPPRSTKLAIIVAFVISGNIIVIVAILVALCYVTNGRRRKAQLERKGLGLDLGGLEVKIHARDGAGPYMNSTKWDA
jgi:hypothetical protein